MPAQHLINQNLFEAGYLFAYSRQGGGGPFHNEHCTCK